MRGGEGDGEGRGRGGEREGRGEGETYPDHLNFCEAFSKSATMSSYKCSKFV